MDLSPFFLFLLFFAFTLFLPIKSMVSFNVKMESFWAGRIFSPELIKKFIVELSGHVGFFSGNLVFS